MRPGTPVLILSLSAIALAAVVSAEPMDASRFMPVEEIRPGMTGEGFSAFSTGGVERFEVEVIDVLEKSGPHRNLILARLIGPVVEEAGIIAGMSGSPVYIDGRLVGAVAYGWSFSKRPIAGITPIGEMLDVLALPEPPEDVSVVPHARAPMPNEQVSAALRMDGFEPSRLQRIRVPLLVCGFADEAVAQIAERFTPLGLDVIQGGGEPRSGRAPTGEIKGGDPIAMPLVRGDASIAVYGTVTYVEGDRLVAFGHPVFHTSSQRLPLSRGRVSGVLPSMYQSFRFTSADEPIGFFYADRWPGVAGKIGDPPSMLPVELVLTSPDGETRFNYELARDHLLTPGLLESVTLNSILSWLTRGGLNTIRTDVRVHLDTGTTIEHRDLIATMNAPMVLAGQVSAPVSAIFNNPHVVPGVERVEIRAQVDDGVRISSIDRIELLDGPLHPGDVMHVKVTLRPYRDDLRTELLELKIPAGTPTGAAYLKVCDAVSMSEWDRERAPTKYIPRDYTRFIERLKDFPSHNIIEARLYVEGASLVLKGEELGDLPPSVASALAGARVAGGRSIADGIKVASAALELDEHVLGCQTLPVELEEK